VRGFGFYHGDHGGKKEELNLDVLSITVHAFLSIFAPSNSLHPLSPLCVLRVLRG
jgi:hypothetical protein